MYEDEIIIKQLKQIWKENDKLYLLRTLLLIWVEGNVSVTVKQPENGYKDTALKLQVKV